MTQVQVGSGAALLQCAPIQAETVAINVPLGVDSVKADGTEPQPDNVTGDPCMELIVRGPGPSLPRGTILGNAVPSLGFLGDVAPGVTKLGCQVPRLAVHAYQLG
jgi:hypothetical protein